MVNGVRSRMCVCVCAALHRRYLVLFFSIRITLISIPQSTLLLLCFACFLFSLCARSHSSFLPFVRSFVSFASCAPHKFNSKDTSPRNIKQSDETKICWQPAFHKRKKVNSKCGVDVDACLLTKKTSTDQKEEEEEEIETKIQNIPSTILCVCLFHFSSCSIFRCVAVCQGMT